MYTKFLNLKIQEKIKFLLYRHNYGIQLIIIVIIIIYISRVKYIYLSTYYRSFNTKRHK